MELMQGNMDVTNLVEPTSEANMYMGTSVVVPGSLSETQKHATSSTSGAGSSGDNIKVIKQLMSVCVYPGIWMYADLPEFILSFYDVSKLKELILHHDSTVVATIAVLVVIRGAHIGKATGPLTVELEFKAHQWLHTTIGHDEYLSIMAVMDCALSEASKRASEDNVLVNAIRDLYSLTRTPSTWLFEDMPSCVKIAFDYNGLEVLCTKYTSNEVVTVAVIAFMEHTEIGKSLQSLQSHMVHFTVRAKQWMETQLPETVLKPLWILVTSLLLHRRF